MKRLSAGLGALACLFLVSLSRLVQAQTTTEATGSEGPLRHGVAAEVTLTGTVSGSLAKAGPGMVVGSHLLLTTPEGPVDASLGRFGLLANGAIPVAIR